MQAGFTGAIFGTPAYYSRLFGDVDYCKNVKKKLYDLMAGLVRNRGVSTRQKFAKLNFSMRRTQFNDVLKWSVLTQGMSTRYCNLAHGCELRSGASLCQEDDAARCPP